jgi:hypothetical protein
MSSLVVDVRQLRRKKVLLPTPAPVVAAAPPINQTTFERLMEKSPEFTRLVKSLDLVEVSPVALVASRLVPLPELQPAPTAPTDAKVKAIAERTFNTCQSYTRAGALALLVAATSVSEERAAKGLDMMLAQGILSTTGNQSYYLTESTPF